jgi:hypothetical protein
MSAPTASSAILVPLLLTAYLLHPSLGSAWVRGFRDRRDDEPGRRPVHPWRWPGERVPLAIKHWAGQMKIRTLATWWMRESRDSL